MKLSYTKPASCWVEALPMGNGRLGAMAYGDPVSDTIQINEETLWSGWFDEYADNTETVAHLAEIREAIFSGDYRKGSELTQKYMVCGSDGSRGAAYGTYQTAGELHFTFTGAETENITNYRRGLDLLTGVSSSSWKCGAASFSGCVFVSFADGAVFVKYESNHPFDAFLTYTRENSRITYTDASIRMTGAFENSTAYAMAASVSHTGGKAVCEESGIRFQGVTSAEVRLDVRTTYVMPDENGLPKPSSDPEIPYRRAENTVRSADRPFNEALAASAEILGEMMNRVYLRLNADRSLETLPTDMRLERMKNGGRDTSLLETYFAFGRYLLISSSYHCTLPANLQGIWTNEYRPPWSCDYHININIQMNYWLAESCGMPELADAFFDYITFLSRHGRRTARIQYGAGGWTAHTITTPWGFTAPGEGASWGSFMCAGAWCCQHIIMRYEYSLGREFLRKNYDILRSACEFFLDFLVTDPNTGYLVTCPSNSPENSFYANGERCSICAGPTMDNEIIRDLFEGCIMAADVLGTDEEFTAVLREKLGHISPIRVGKHGQIMEWSEDFDEPEPGHRHISHLYALHPSMQIHRDHPELKDACAVTLSRRLASGGGHTGWSRAWITNFYARLGNGDRALDNLNALLAKSTLPNLFDNHPPFQIDGNFGGSAAFAEMLAFSDGRKITLLPALPTDREWQSGEFRGIRLRGNIEADCIWEKGEVKSCRILSHRDDKAVFTLECGGHTTEITIPPRGAYVL